MFSDVYWERLVEAGSRSGKLDRNPRRSKVDLGPVEGMPDGHRFLPSNNARIDERVLRVSDGSDWHTLALERVDDLGRWLGTRPLVDERLEFLGVRDPRVAAAEFRILSKFRLTHCAEQTSGHFLVDGDK